MKETITVNVTNDDDTPFFESGVKYDNLSRMDVVTLEKILLETMHSLHAIGVEKAKGRK
jgi:hypothetical protein